mmetsp:Transcript_24447/g.75504  ORF Transcript_24447/g.75504 Transcript_24447/m.75504 type:complete len:201 (+) Transcript_24447:649-1251(+)
MARNMARKPKTDWTKWRASKAAALVRGEDPRFRKRHRRSQMRASTRPPTQKAPTTPHANRNLDRSVHLVFQKLTQSGALVSNADRKPSMYITTPSPTQKPPSSKLDVAFAALLAHTGPQSAKEWPGQSVDPSSTLPDENSTHCTSSAEHSRSSTATHCAQHKIPSFPFCVLHSSLVTALRKRLSGVDEEEEEPRSSSSSS